VVLVLMLAGGAIFAKTDVVITGTCLFENNTAAGDTSVGGAIQAICGNRCSSGGTQLNLTGITRFISNAALGDGAGGGALYVKQAVNVLLEGVTFSTNRVVASSKGGKGGAMELSGQGEAAAAPGWWLYAPVCTQLAQALSDGPSSTAVNKLADGQIA
jgi:predicted outer membrane repeat protein